MQEGPDFGDKVAVLKSNDSKGTINAEVETLLLHYLGRAVYQYRSTVTLIL